MLASRRHPYYVGAAYPGHLQQVCVTVGRPSVRLFCCLTAAAVCGGFAAERPADKTRSATNAGSDVLTADWAELRLSTDLCCPAVTCRSIQFCSLAVLDPRVGHTMDVLTPFIPVLCHSD